MAFSEVTTIIANPARKRGRKANNVARRRLSRAQIAAGFGGKRRQSAQKSRRRPARKAHRAKSRPKSNPAPRRKRASVRTTRRRSVRRRSNPGEIISLTLGNPARRKKAMARSSRKRKAGARRHHSAGTRRTRRNPARRHHRRNPGGGNMGGIVKTSVAVIGGAVGSKILPQMVLGSKNTGIMGYLGNAVAGGALAWASKMFFKDRQISQGIIVGTAVQLILRVIGDTTAFGSYLSLSGLGDYMASNFVQPQRLIDGLNSAMVELPQGWGPGAMPLLTAGGGGVNGLYDGSMPGGGPLY